MNEYKTIEELKSKTLTTVEVGVDEVVFACTDGARYLMYHEQQCCESVVIDSIDGDPQNLVGHDIVVAQETFPEVSQETLSHERSCTLTDFTLTTTNGACVVFHWNGSSNGYYSESVYFKQIS